MGRKIVFALIGTLIGLGVLEGGARVIERSLAPSSEESLAPGWQTRFFSELFDWHEPDPALLWRFKADLDNPLIKTNHDHFIGDELRPKAPGVFRIVVLGDSSPVGLGLRSRKETFAALLPLELRSSLGEDLPIEVLNAAVSGYSSEQIRRLVELRGDDLDPDAVVLYCGNNDASVSGPVSDNRLLEMQRLVGLRRAASHLSLYRVLRSMLAKDDRSESDSALVVRVSPERFEENVRTIAAFCASRDCRLYVCEPPVPLLWPAGLQFRIFRHVTDEDGEILLPERMREVLQRNIHYCLSPARFRVLYGEGDRITRAVWASAPSDTLPAEEYRAGVRRRLEAQPGDAVGWNNLGVSYWSAGVFDSAALCLETARGVFVDLHGGDSSVEVNAAGSPILFNRGIVALSAGPDSLTTHIGSSSSAYIWLDSALQADYYSLRIKRGYVERLQRLATLPNVRVIDLPAIFATSGGEALFVDHCHPTARGHQLIARALGREIASDFNAAEAN
ncbi:SGNH/GDSL hydrolase family protein [bacterium]|nr:SGNH/GDSL hydrolase family protein [bacterium]